MASAIIIDRHALDRRAITRVIEDECQLKVVAEADDVSEALLMSRNYCPEWLWVTPADDPMGTLDTLMRVRCNCPKTRIVILAAEKFTAFVDRAFNIGVTACISKDCGVAELKEAVAAIMHGKRYLGKTFARLMINAAEQQEKQNNIHKLTNRELQIMLMFVENMNVEQIASRLCLSPKTVSTYRYRIFDKMDVRGDVALMHRANECGMLNNIPVMHYAA
jgi:two-component system invasion response regulator UvrY